MEIKEPVPLEESDNEIFIGLYILPNGDGDYDLPPCPGREDIDPNHQGEVIPVFFIESIDDADLFRI